MMIAAALAATLFVGAAMGGTIVQTGEITQLGETVIVLDQFDDEMGTRRLDSVRIDLSSGMFGGFTTNGTGGSVHVEATFDQDYFLDNQRLAGTHCVFRDTLPNTAVVAFSFFIPDDDAAVIGQPSKLAPWIGPGQVTLTSFGAFDVNISPADGLLDFGAGLSADYTITYDFTVLDCAADLNGDGFVDVLDLLAVVGAFGNVGGPEDINGDGIVDVMDLLEVIGSWGVCPSG
jgi:hypothetical protein